MVSGLGLAVPVVIRMVAKLAFEPLMVLGDQVTPPSSGAMLKFLTLKLGMAPGAANHLEHLLASGSEELSRPVDGGCGVQSVTAPPGGRIGVCGRGERVERVVDRLVLVGEHHDLVVFGAACPVTTPRVPLKTPSALILL
jgi:hypothetical protein